MLRLTVLLVGLAVCVSAVRDHCCSAGDREVVQKQWNKLWRSVESSKIKANVGKLALLKVLELKPEAKALFTAVNVEHPESGEFSAHALRIMNGLDMAINLLDDPDALDEALDHLASQHAARAGVKKEYFKLMGEVLGSGLSKILDNYNSLSWKACFKGILGKMTAKLPA